MVVVGVQNHCRGQSVKRWQGSQRRIKKYERERLREEKVQSLIRKLKNFVSEDEEEECARRQGIGQGGKLYENRPFRST